MAKELYFVYKNRNIVIKLERKKMDEKASVLEHGSCLVHHFKMQIEDELPIEAG